MENYDMKESYDTFERVMPGMYAAGYAFTLPGRFTLSVEAELVDTTWDTVKNVVNYKAGAEVFLSEAMVLRAGFFTEAGMLAEGCRSTGEELTIVFVDLDRFKAVNDRYGHSAGDRVLTVVAERLVDGLPPEALVARLAGDEFVAAITGPPPPAEVLAALGAALRRPIPLGGTTVEIDATFGIDTERGAATDLDALLASSDEMMLARKRFRAEPRRSA